MYLKRSISENKEQSWRLIMRLLALFRPYGGWMVLGLLVSLAASLSSIILLGISGWFITAMGLAGVAGASINYFTPAAIIRACAIVRTGGRYGQQLITHEATFRLIARLRRWFYDCLEPLSPAGIGYLKSGDLFSRIRSDIDILERFYLRFLVPAGVALLVSIIIVTVLFFYSRSLAFSVGGILVFAGFLLPFWAFWLSQETEHDLVNQHANLRADLSGHLSGMGELLIYDLDGKFEQEINEKNVDVQRSKETLHKRMAIAENLNGLFASSAMFVTLGFSFYLLTREKIGSEIFVMLPLLVFACFEAITVMPSAFQGLGGVLRAAERIFDISDQKPSVKDPVEQRSVPSRFDIIFQDVNFSYQTEGLPVLENLNFTLKAGEKMAIIGPTGCGKSSIVNLLMRFYESQSGNILIGEHNIGEYRGEDVRQAFSVLPQKPYIFNATIRQNLLYANNQASQKEIDEAMKQAGLFEFVEGLPLKYDTSIGEHGKALSGGQIKRLALARALLKKTSCLILDEPGEGLDYEMERDILQRVINNLNSASLILISHRDNGLEDMDQILSLEEKDI